MNDLVAKQFPYDLIIRFLNKGLKEARPTPETDHIIFHIELFDSLFQDLVTILQNYSRAASPKP